jgi:hypothetical protein
MEAPAPFAPCSAVARRLLQPRAALGRNDRGGREQGRGGAVQAGSVVGAAR